MDTNLYWTLRGTFTERQAQLASWSEEALRASILDREYNDFLRARADLDDDEYDLRGHGKRLPYIGWFWRHLEFHSGRLPIGNCGHFIGFMPNNKWDYAERTTTDAEFNAIMKIIDEAMRLSSQGGALSKIIANTNAKLDELWDLLQTMRV